MTIISLKVVSQLEMNRLNNTKTLEDLTIEEVVVIETVRIEDRTLSNEEVIMKIEAKAETTQMVVEIRITTVGMMATKEEVDTEFSPN